MSKGNQRGCTHAFVIALALFTTTAAFAQGAAGKKSAVMSPDELILSSKSGDLVCAWQLDYARARQMVVELLAAGNPAKALEAAKAQFVLSPPEEAITDAAITSVKGALIALDGNDTRAGAFADYANWGLAGRDRKPGTSDDCENPIAEIGFSVLKRDKRYYEEIDAGLDMRATRCAYIREVLWFEVEKAYARLNGGEFDEALRILLGARFKLDESLRSVNKEDATAMGNIADDEKRIGYGIAAVYRAAKCTTAGMTEYVEAWQAYLRYGPAGKDGSAGTADDLVPPRGAGDWSPRVAEIPPELATALAVDAADPASKRIEARLDAIGDAYLEIAWKLPLLDGSKDGGWARVIAAVAPSPYEVFRDLSAKTVATRPSFEGLSERETERLKARIREARDVSLGYVVKLHNDPAKAQASGQPNGLSRAFVSAYVLGTYEGPDDVGAIKVVGERLAGGKAPVFLVDDAVKQINDVSAALAAVDMIDASGAGGWAEGERCRRLTEIAELARNRGELGLAESAYDRVVKSEKAEFAEAAQYSIIELYSTRAQQLMASVNQAKMAEGRGVYLKAATACSRYVELYAQSGRLLRMKYFAALYRYYGADYAEAIEDAEAFLAKYNEPEFVPNVLLVAGLSYTELNDTGKAVESLERIAEKYPTSPVASHAQLAIATCYMRSARYDEAKSSLRRVIDFYPDTPSAARAKSMLETLDSQEKARSGADSKVP